MSTTPLPITTQDDPSATGAQPNSAPQGSGIHLFLARLANALQTMRAPLSQIGDSLIEAGGSDQQRQGLQFNKELALRQQDENDRQQLLRSQLSSADLQRQRAQQEMSAFQTPQQKQAMDLDTQQKLLALQRANSEPQLLTVPGENGAINYYERRFNPATNDWEITPAMANTEKIISSPDNPQIPYDPTQTIRQTQRSQLTAQNPEIFKNQLDLAREISFATNPLVEQGKIDVATAEGRARANVEANAARGSNAALANVPANLIAPATAAATKAGEDFAQSKSVSDRLAAMMQAAKNGNVVSYQLIPQEGALQVTTSQGVHRINMAEIQNYGGGSLFQRMEGHFGKALTGQSIPASVLGDMSEMQNILAQGARAKYENSLKTINRNYGSNFQPVEMGGLTPTGNRPPLSSFEH